MNKITSEIESSGSIIPRGRLFHVAQRVRSYRWLDDVTLRAPFSRDITWEKQEACKCRKLSMGMLLRCNKDGTSVEDYVSHISREIAFLILDNISQMCYIWIASYVETRITCTYTDDYIDLRIDNLPLFYLILSFCCWYIEKYNVEKLCCLIKKNE